MSLPDLNHTIAAIATAQGRGGIGIVRLSGPQARAIGEQVARCSLLPRHAHYGPLHDTEGQLIDHAISLFFAAPASYTGEDIVEWQAHGGPVVLDLLLETALALGAQPAEPGAFTLRAFLNGKMDLNQAEAVADLINSNTRAAVRAANQSLQGRLSQRIAELQNGLITLRCELEAQLDFSDEDLEPQAGASWLAGLQTLSNDLQHLRQGIHEGQLLQHGIKVALIGPPNAGKSSLLNALTERETAIVSAIAGTTRDVVQGQIQIKGMPLHLIDTAGLHDSEDELERMGMERSQQAMQQADLILCLFDINDTQHNRQQALIAQLPQATPCLHLWNKVDQWQGTPPHHSEEAPALLISAKTGQGLDTLKQHIAKLFQRHEEQADVYAARQRHIHALNQVQEHIEQALNRFARPGSEELVAHHLYQAQQALTPILGRYSNDDLLGDIFGRFCIGK